MSTKIEPTKASGKYPGSKHQPSKPITFRLDPECNMALLDRASQLGISPHELARGYVREALTTSVAFEELFKAITTIRKEQLHLREAVGRSVEVLFVSAGKIPREDAKNWANETFGLK